MKTIEKAALADGPNSNLLANNYTIDLPDSINDRVQCVLDSGLSPQKGRLLPYILNHPNAWTHQLAANCAVGYPPNRIGELNKEILPQYGLHILCHKPEKWLQNRYGDTSHVHQWRLIKVPVSNNGVAA
jgi:hypothetical protein